MEKVKTYFGDYVWNLGKPIVILTSYESGNDIHCERTIIIETVKEPISIVSGMRANKDEWKKAQEFYSEPKSNEQLIEQFMYDWGLEQAKADLFGIIMDIGEKEKLDTSMFFNPNPILNENKTVNTIMYLKRKLPELFDSIRNKTKSQELKALMDLANGISITYYEQGESR